MVEQNSINFNSADFDITAGVFELDDAVLKSVSSDAGAATPSAHAFTVAGANGISTDAAGATLTVTAAGGSGDWVYISSATANNSATIDFTGLSSTYFTYAIIATNIVPATNNVDLLLRTSTNGGASYDSGASDYAWGVEYISTYPWDLFSSSTADSKIQIIDDNGSASNEKTSFILYIYNPSSTKMTALSWDGEQLSQSPDGESKHGYGLRLSEADVDAVQFYISSGNITTGTFKLYGVAAS